MNITNFNLERTRAPRRKTPIWVYAGAILLAGLLVWAVVNVLPGERAATTDVEPATAQPATSADVASPPSAQSPATPGRSAVPPPATSVSAASSPTTAQSAARTPALREAVTAKEAGDFLKARELALAIWKSSGGTPTQREAEAILNEVNIALVMSPRPMPEKEEYVVQSGDSLERIAKRFGTTIELLRAGNNIRGSLIKAGDRLRVFTGKFSLSVSKSDNDLVLFMNGDFFKRYRVGTGEYNKTPVGDFIINDRIAQPTWWRPDGKSIPYGDPENLLGTHWLSINVKGYGLHGTWEPDTIGKQLSAGCVRLLNEDIEQLYTLLPLGTPVSIRD